MKAVLLPLAFVAGASLAGAAQAGNDATKAEQRALAHIDAHASNVARASGDTFELRNTITDADGSEHVRFNRSYRGLRVIGGDLVVHSHNGAYTGSSLTLTSSVRPSLSAKLSADAAIVEAGAHFGTDFVGMPSASLVVFARDAKPVLAYEVRFEGVRADETPTDMYYYVDANSGKLLDWEDHVETAAAVGSGKTLTLGTVTLNTDSTTSGYQLVDRTRGNGTTKDNFNGSTTSSTGTVFTDADNVWGNGTTSDRASAAADAHFGVAATWDYYKNTFGRNGIKNDGRGAVSLVHVGTKWVNASWSDACFCMRYGDGDGVTYRPLVALDVAGHEMTHGVTAAVNGLAYSRDAGGLNEGSSDIMGTMVEFSVNNPNDPGDWLIGEEIYISNPDGTKALRRMFKQDMDGRSYVCYPSGGFSSAANPHYTSGVANRFAYLLSQGSVVPAGFGSGTSYNLTPASLVCNGDTGIVGIGRVKAAAIWYRAMDVYFTSGTTYPNARTATLNAAKDLYGATSAEYKAVGRAWDATNVH